MVEQAFVDVANLLDVEGAEREPPRFGGAAAWHCDAEDLERLQQVQHRAIVHRQGPGVGRFPVRFLRTAFEEGEAVGVEEVATVGRQAQILVLHTSEDSAKGRQEAAPGVAAALQHLLASCIGCFAQLGA